MILSNVSEIKISNNQIKYYKNLGYNIKGGNELKEIKIEHLPLNSRAKISVKCDFCSKEKILSYNQYNLNTNNGKRLYACSRKCAEVKSKETNIINHGVENISQLEEIKEKKKETCLINNGVEYPQQSKEIFKKSLNKKLEKYGDQNFNNNEKRISTCIERYGESHPSKITEISNKIKLKLEKFYKDRIINDEKYLKLKIRNYNNGRYIFDCDCDKTHEFEIDYKLLWQRLNSKTILCTICNPIDRHISGKETQFFNFIKENYTGEIIENNRDIIKPYELDIYLPELKLSFEFNGLFWHSELYKEKNYHLNKTDLCQEKGIQLIHIWEDDWDYKQEIVKSIILNKLNKTPNKIMSRKCEIKEIDNKLIRDFLNNNHIQGYINSSVKIGLFYNDELVSLMTFGKKRKFMNSVSKENEWELLRFCNKLNTNVVGGASKLFKYFIKNYKYNEIITYADRSHSKGDLYKKLGFQYIDKTKPNYYYIVGSIRKYRFGFRKDILVKEGCESSKTEHEIMLERGINRIYNSGNLKYIYKL